MVQDRDIHLMQEALRLARTAYATGEVPIGDVVVSPGGGNYCLWVQSN